jgi:hypothetical protein
MSDPSLYDRDFYAWANEQAALLRAGNLSAADIEYIADEIESIARAEKRELVRQLAVLLPYLLKWQYQPMLRGRAWAATIRIQRHNLARHMLDNPSLKAKVAEAIKDAYGDAIIGAGAETGLGEATFPIVCPWPFDQIMAEDFWPGDAAH